MKASLGQILSEEFGTKGIEKSGMVDRKPAIDICSECIVTDEGYSEHRGVNEDRCRDGGGDHPVTAHETFFPASLPVVKKSTIFFGQMKLKSVLGCVRRAMRSSETFRWIRTSLSIPMLLAIGALVTGCAGAIAPVGTGTAQSIEAGIDSHTTTKIKHVVILIQENRSFDNLFAIFPGADGVRRGKIHTGAMVPLAKHDLLDLQDMQHSYRDYVIDYNHGQMDGFDLASTASGNANGLLPYQFVAPDQIAVYWSLAKRYTLADHMFTTAGSDSFIGHQDLVAGGTQIDADDAIMDAPDAQPWGCDAPAGTVTSLITSSGRFTPSAGPFPCLSYATLADLLDRRNVTWRYYCSHPTDDWNAFEAIRAVRYSPHWRANISAPQTNIFKDIAGGSLTGVSWVVPTADYSDHPGEPHDYGPDWIGNIVNAIGESPYWRSTAIIIVWDDWGGFYDHVAPRHYPFGELGFRVPAIIVSPYARAGRVAHVSYEFGSILRFVEDNWNLGRLGTSDVRATSISGALNFQQKPRGYVPVKVAHPRSFFLSLPLSNRPLDSE